MHKVVMRNFWYGFIFRLINVHIIQAIEPKIKTEDNNNVIIIFDKGLGASKGDILRCLTFKISPHDKQFMNPLERISFPAQYR